ncbi:aldehyde dehydrogenase [Streptomyces carpinensis]|uniref:aldehyde dehydrogenase (NAD(+)) n=1 Tax=Streptomyces carpinensis TaxID=66369 RepID=A0ABV1VWK5_9ACTN|nr:aldehyde dehydrogenase [Streptomyces carpinensis]
MTVTKIGSPRLRSFDRLFIGGEWVKPATDKVIDVVSPSTEEWLASVPEASVQDVDAAAAAARRAFDEGPWPRMRPAERAEALLRVRAEIEKRYDAMVAAFSAEIGAPTAISHEFNTEAMDAWTEAAKLLETFEFEQERPFAGGSGTLVHEPVGVVAAVVPWNGPVDIACLKSAPALAAGCTVVIKAAPEGPVAMMLLAEALEAAGLPEGVVSLLPADREVSEYLVSHPAVDKVSFTGSTATGRRIMSICSERIARVSLELGGKSAGIIADDIAMTEVVETLGFAGVVSSGQVCAAITRVIVPRERQQELLDVLVPFYENLKVGDPSDPETDLGPLVARRQLDRVLEYIEIGKAEGARLITGGGRPAGFDKGWFVAPTIFADVANDMRIAQEEIFGPVVCVIPYDTLEEAIDMANDSPYGLSGAVYAKDTQLAERIARRIRTGQMSINGWFACMFQPFGGFKQSGIGREGGVEGLTAYLEPKFIQRSA